MPSSLSKRAMRWPAAAALAALVAVAGCSDRNPTGPTFTPVGGTSNASPASFTATNSGVDGPGHCNNGQTPDPVNCNLYDGKEYVWLNAGPDGANLADGTYFFTVSAPGGQSDPNDGNDKNLSWLADGDWTTREFSVLGGVVSYSGPRDFDGSLIRLFPYEDTPNNGGVYILTICSVPHPAASSQCKSDAFKAREGGGGGEQGNPEMSGMKYFDANRNGQWDEGEDGIPGWLIDWTDGTSGTETTDADGFFFWSGEPDTYTFTERQPNNAWAHPGTGWYQTGNTVDQTVSAGAGQDVTLANFVYTVVAVEGGFTDGLNFGNVCRVSVEGRTIGYWRNRGLKDLFTTADRHALNAFLLANGTGEQGNFGNNNAFASWLQAANATNMAYMLSAQMAATYLNITHGISDGSAIVDWTDNAFTAGFGTPAPRTLAETVDYAQYLLGLPGGLTTTEASALRTEQERIKNIFDTANNSGSFYPADLETAIETCGTPDFAAP